MLESDYQPLVIERLNELFPGAIILKNDSGYMQGIPDLSIFYNDRWAMLEVKPTIFARFQPNQEWYLDTLNAMSFAAMICPENEEEVYREIQLALRAPR